MLSESFGLAWKMLSHRRGRLVGGVFGVAMGFFLAAAQIGLLVGWINTNTALIRHADADLWVVAEKTPAYDYGTRIPRQLMHRLRGVEGVERTRGLFMAWNIWQRPDGRQVNVELVGLDDDGAGGPWRMLEGSVDCLQRPQTVIVDELYLDALGVESVGDEFEMIGRTARVGGISQGVRTFTASPFVFTSIDEAIAYDRRHRDDEITYVLGWCADGVDPKAVAAAAREVMPEVEVLTSGAFALRSAKYWMLETGVGVTVIITAVLGLVIGGLIVSQTLFSLVHDNLPHFATLMAVGFSASVLGAVVRWQALMLGGMGMVVGSVLFLVAALALARSAIPLETTLVVYGGLLVVGVAACLAASQLAIRRLFKIDPVSVFG